MRTELYVAPAIGLSKPTVDGIISEIRDDKARLPGIQTVLASAACSAALPRRTSVAPLLMTSLVAPR